MRNVSVAILGARGQQGTRSGEKVGVLYEKGKPICEVYLVDVQEEGLEQRAASLRSKGLTVKTFVGDSADFLFEYQPDVILDATNTAYRGRDSHANNLVAYLSAIGSSKGKAIGFEDVPPQRAYGIEKPVSKDEANARLVLQEAKAIGLPITVHAVESYMDVKQKTLKDILTRGVTPEAIRMDRLSSVQSKMATGGRKILTDNGGATIDKLPHDVNYLLDVIRATKRVPEEPVVNSVDFDILELATAQGPLYVQNNGLLTDAGQSYFVRMAQRFPDKAAYWSNQAQKVFSEHLPALNEVYTEARLRMNGVDVSLTASQLGLKQSHIERIDKDISPETRRIVSDLAKAQGKDISPDAIKSAYGVNGRDMETRTTVIEHTNRGKHVLQTYGPIFYGVYEAPSGSVEPVHVGWNDGHLRWVENTIDCALGTDTPITHIDDVLMEVHILNILKERANRSGRVQFDLTKQPTEIQALFDDSMKQAILG